MNIDPNLLSIMLGLITNGLTSLIGQSGHKVKELLIGKDFLEKWEREKTALEPILHKAIGSIAETVEWKGPAREEVVCLFLLSPEVEEIVRQIYSTRFERPKSQDDLSSIREIFLTSFTDFVTSYAAEATLQEEQLKGSVTLLLDALITGCNFVLNQAIDEGILAAHEAKSAFRYNVIHSEIEAIQKKLDFLVGSYRMDIQAILDFESRYRSQVGKRHNSITPPNFDIEKKVAFDRLFVYPRFRTSPQKNVEPSVLKMDEFFSSIHRAVVLGNPGGGKSTLTLKLCYDLANKYSERWFAGRKQLTPILVVLREYGADKKKRNCSVLDFIEDEVKATYQLPQPPPPHAFEYLLLNGRAAVIFDGLDELLDTTYRQEIRSDVESFCQLYPSVPVLVTSREVGYEQAPLDKEMFEVFRLAEFDESQIQDYVKKWFNVEDANSTSNERQSKVEAFLKESQIVPDLRSNPLMLALLCNIYKGENYIPRNRPEVYEKCALMLFERWDKSRQLFAPPVFEEHMRPLLEDLAQWIYADEMLRKGVTEDELATKAAEYLHGRVFEDILKAESISKEFIKFCTIGRAWVFLDTGTEKEGAKLYQFAHSTFLEYFTAAHYVSTSRTPKGLIALLRPRIAKREWDVMAQLAFQLQNKRILGAGDELLTALINSRSRDSSEKSWNLLSFAVRCLKFMIPRPTVTRSISDTCIERTLFWGLEQKNRKAQVLEDEEITPKKVIGTLICARPDNCEVIADSLKKQLIEQINNGSEVETLLALEISTSFEIFRYYDMDKQGYLESNANFWQGVSKHIVASCADRLSQIYPKYADACIYALENEIIRLADFIQWHGIEAILHSVGLKTFTGEIGGTLLENFVYSILFSSGNERKRVQYSTYLNEVVSILLDTPTPWITKEYGFGFRLLDRLYIEYPIYKQMEIIDRDLFFSIFAIFAISLESAFDNDIFVILNRRLRRFSDSTFMKFLDIMYTARDKHERIELVSIRAEITNIGFSSKQQEFVWRWIRGEINLVQP